MLDIDKTLSELANEEPIFDDQEEAGEALYEAIDDDDDDDDDERSAGRSALPDADVSELAAELSAVQSDDELEEWIGRMFRKVKRRVGRFARSPAGRKLFSVIKKHGKSALKKYANKYLEEEGFDEGMSMEAAEQFVRFAAEATVSVIRAPDQLPADEVVSRAIARAGRRHRASRKSSATNSGRWIRRGRNIILLGV